MTLKLNVDGTLRRAEEKLTTLFELAQQETPQGRTAARLARRLPAVIEGVRAFQAFRADYTSRPFGFPDDQKQIAIEALEDAVTAFRTPVHPALGRTKPPSPLTTLIYELRPMERIFYPVTPRDAFFTAVRDDLMALQKTLDIVVRQQRDVLKIPEADIYAFEPAAGFFRRM